MNNLNQDYLSYRSDCQNCDKKPCDDLYKNKCIPNLTNKVCTNSGFNFGVSSRLQYDNDYQTNNPICHLPSNSTPLLICKCR